VWGEPNLDRLERKGKVQKLIAVVESGKSGWIRRDAVVALGRLEDQRATEPLARTLAKRHEDTDVRVAAAEVLGHIGDARTLNVLLATLCDPIEAVRRASADAVARFGAHAVAPLVALLSEESPPRATDSTCSVAWALGRIGGPDAIAALEDVLHEDRPKVRKAVYQALRHAGWSPQTPYQRALTAVLERRWEAAGREGQVAVTLLTSELSGDPPGVSRGLVATGDRRGLEAVGKAVESGGETGRAAAQALSEATLESPASADILVGAVAHIPGAHDRLYVANLIESQLGSLASSTNPELRLQAVRAIDLLGLTSKEATRVLGELCTDPDEDVWRATIRCLGERPVDQADIVVPVLREWCDDPVAGPEATAALRRFESRVIDIAVDPPGDLAYMVSESMFAIDYLVRTGCLDSKLAGRLAQSLKSIERLCRAEDASHGYTTYSQLYARWLDLVRWVLSAH
jgi:HEAT repeat protein